MPSTQQPDLSERLLADDEQVLEDVLRTFGPPIRAVLCRKYRGVLTGDDIEDVLAIGLFRFWVNRYRFDEQKGTLRVWFFRIVDNAARDVLKHGWHKARRLETAVEPSVLATFADPRQNGRDNRRTGPNMSAAQMEIREIVDSLPAVQKSIVMADALTRDGTASSQLLAEELNLPASTVRVYRKRALDKIRTELKRRGHQV